MPTAQPRDRRANFVHHALNLLGTETLYRPILDLAIGHHVRTKLLEDLRVLAAADTLVTFQNALGDARIEHFDIAGNAQPRHFADEVI